MARAKKERSATLKGGLLKRNLWGYSLGGIGRDMMYQLFNTYMISCITFTKGVNTAQLAIVGIIIVCCRIFDALNDPIMGSIIEITHTKWGKFKPWIMIGAVTNAILVFFMFWAPLEGNDFIIFYGIAYIFWSITFTMNDISYWSMLPSLAKDAGDRDTLSSVANLTAGIGAGLAIILIPLLTAGDYTIAGNASTAYTVISAVFGCVFIACQLFTCLTVKEEPLPPKKSGKMDNPLKNMFKVLKGNDQLQKISLVMLVYNLGSSITGGLSTYYVYFKFGYQGAMVSLFGIITGIAGGLLIIYPLLSKKFGRRTIMKISMGLVVLGYTLMLIMGLFVNNFYAIAVCGVFYAIGQSTMYMVQTISISNTVEYNEWKTGERQEGIIFSIRPFMAKMGSALQMGVVTVILYILRIADTTNQISEQENLANIGTINSEEKLANIDAIIATVSEDTKIALLCCMTILPIILVCLAGFLYLWLYKIDEKKYEEIRMEIAERKSATAEGSAIEYAESAVDGMGALTQAEMHQIISTEDSTED